MVDKVTCFMKIPEDFSPFYGGGEFDLKLLSHPGSYVYKILITLHS